jgi:hypothetical protein
MARQPKGIPTGGQFASVASPESEVELEEPAFEDRLFATLEDPDRVEVPGYTAVYQYLQEMVEVANIGGDDVREMVLTSLDEMTDILASVKETVARVDELSAIGHHSPAYLAELERRQQDRAAFTQAAVSGYVTEALDMAKRSRENRWHHIFSATTITPKARERIEQEVRIFCEAAMDSMLCTGQVAEQFGKDLYQSRNGTGRGFENSQGLEDPSAIADTKSLAVLAAVYVPSRLVAGTDGKLHIVEG